MKNNWNFLLALLLFAACQTAPTEDMQREILDMNGQEVITTFANTRLGTQTTLYGNKAAMAAAMDSTGAHQPGEIFTLVTWSQVGNPRWYGSNINGRLLSMETVRTTATANNGIFTAYKLEKGAAPRDANGATINAQQRINLITQLPPSVFP